MMNVKIEDKGVVNGLSNMIATIRSDPERMLDRMAEDVRSKMRNEAPQMTGQLKSEIEIQSTTNKRVIEPVALRSAPSGVQKYGGYVESGSRYYAKMPPVENIVLWMGVSKSIAFAIAKKIQQSGTPANPFVKRTYDWITARASAYLGDLANSIKISYSRG